jgi:hypothetical protein
MKKLIVSLTLALVVTALGASTVFADGSDTIFSRVHKQGKEPASTVANHDVTVNPVDGLKAGSPAWRLGLR